jgi:hypothetical protein
MTKEEIIIVLEAVRKRICGYMGDHCDCKYGYIEKFEKNENPELFAKFIRGEQTGCPELRDVINFIQSWRYEMKPCDCKDMHTLETKLSLHGIGYNEDYIKIEPPNVILGIGSCQLKIPMYLFKRFAEWYFEDQNKN